VERYPEWQAWLRREQPPTLIVWGTGDAIFVEAGAHAYLRDLPDAEVHVVDSGHFALEDKLSDIAPLIAGFLDRVWDRAEP
jgi:pimeloyl-ACP methyl ester carboxylesterase